MRGERSRPLRQPVFSPRFIPACAGNAIVKSESERPVTVHPRMRGERRAKFHDAAHRVGSSPHARGTRIRPSFGVQSFRFIPACAGNAILILPQSVTLTVHPRMRGERQLAVETVIFAVGSSPHARGTLHQRAVHGSNPRFIPACAGNAAMVSARSGDGAVHPRMRGERGI